MTSNLRVVEEIRAASRAMARAWGYMGGDFADTKLSPSAVHALIEVESGNVTARDLSACLQLEKSSVSRMLRKLIDSGDLSEGAGTADGRTKVLSLTPVGRQRVAAIHAYARSQVHDALSRLQPSQDRVVLQGLSLYADALTLQPGGRTRRIEVTQGYQTGLIARITHMHAHYYARESGFGKRFEAVVAGGLAAFCPRLENPRNAIWTASQDGEIVGSVAIDGEDLGANIAHLRWFIVDDSVRGGGVGRKLLTAALAFADSSGFAQTQLWTFSGLSAARHLYESHGFELAEEWRGDQWGKEVLEQRFVRTCP